MSLQVDGAVKSYPDRRGESVPALRGVDLTVDAGELVVLIGPSGSGKSTLLRAVAGLEPLDDGRVRIAGADVTHRSPGARSVALVFQDLALFPHLTVRQNIGFGARARGVPPDVVARDSAEAAGLLGIDHLMSRRPGQLSGGERQRVALARALLRRPDLFLLDEPLSSVDTELRARLREEVRDLQRRTGVAMVHVTHDQTEAMAMGDRVVVLRDGRVEQVGRPSEVWQRPATVFVARLVGDVPLNVFPAAAVGEPGDHLVAVRAADVRIAAAGKGFLDTDVQDITLQAGAAVVRLSSGAGPVHAQVAWSDRPRTGDRCSVTWSGSAVHRFDADSGRRLP